MNWIDTLGLIGGLCMPLSNIPLIYKIVRARSSSGISLGWMYMVWGCIICMAPASIASTDVVLKTFGIANLIMFSVVVATVLKFR